MYKLNSSGSIVRIADGATIPEDLGNSDYRDYLDWTASGNVAKMEMPTVAETITAYTAAIQKRLDDFARTRSYDGILSAATYATSTVPKLAAEGQYAVEARDATWAKGYEILAAVEAGQRTAPALDELAAELPALAWPV